MSTGALASLEAKQPVKGVDMRAILRRPSPAMIVACLALLVSLGGTSVAAVSQLARNSVGTPQLRNNAVTAPKIANNAVVAAKIRNASVTNPKIANNAVNSAKVANNSLTRVDFAPGQLPAGPTGPQGPAGPAGPAGPRGPTGAISAITVRSQSTSIASAGPDGNYQTAEVTALCSSGELSISGGTGWSDSDANLELWTGRLTPVLNTTNQVVGWRGVGGNDSGQSSTFIVYALCYTPGT
jgi:hypothetical protein